MYKRPKRTHNGILVNKTACASTARENVVNDDVNESPTSVGSGSNGLGSSVKETSVTSHPSQNIVNISNKPTESWNLQDIFSSCGMDVDAEPANILKLDQAIFVKNLNSKLYSSRGRAPENIKKFIDNLKDYYSNNDRFLKALSPTSTSPDCDVARGSTQDSLMRLLLQIEELQTQLANYLLDRLGELALQNEINFDFEMTPVTWVRLILQPFRYLNRIVDSKNLCERLFDIIFSSPDKQIQQEVIIYLPDIIGDMEHHFAASELSKLLKSELELMPPILDALTNLSVQSEIRKDVRRSLIETLKTSPIEYLPNIVKFLLCTCDSNSYDEVLSGLRRELFADDSVSLKNTMNEENVDVEGVKVLVFSNIRNCLLANKQLADSWIKNISQLNTETKCRPFDLLVVLILFDICTENTRKRNIETMFRSRVKNELFTTTLIDKTFEHFVPVIIEYFTPLMSILSKLLKSVDTAITEFVTSFYLICFEQTTQQWCRIIIKELLAYIGAGDANDAQTALNILSAIAVKYPEKIRPLASMLRVLLNKLMDLPLKDVQQLMDMLCCIAFTETNDETDIMLLKTEITSLIEKQISSSNIKLLRVSIICAVMAIKHIAMFTDDESNQWPDKSSDDFDENLLSEKAKKALPFLKLIVDGTRVVPEAQGFGFDQFSLMLKKYKNLDKSLLFYTSIVMKENMKKYFLICNDEVKQVELVECCLKFGLNEDDEFVVLNLTPTLIEELNSNISAGLRMYLLVLPSLLRLVRELEYEDLREIDGLLECPVVVPSPKAIEEFALQSPEVQSVIMDSFFYLTNWFREIVNCFARMIKQPTGKKVLVRLRTLIWLQKLIAKYLPQMLKRDYCPPKCHFHKSVKIPAIGSDKKKKKTSNKKKNDSKTPDIRKHLVRSQPTIQEESDNEDTKENTEETANMKNYKQFFRELDWDIWVMLSLPLTLEPEPEKDWELKPEFGPSELLFIMEDLVEKLHFVLISSNKKTPFKHSSNSDIGLTSSSLYVSAPELFVKNLVKLTPRLCTHLDSLAQFCETLLTKNDNIFDASGMFVPETREIKSSYALILKAFSILFSWPGFEGSNNQDVFVAALTKISSRVESAVRSTSTYSLIKACVMYFAQFQDTSLNLECALNLVTLIETLNKYCDEKKEVNKLLGKICWHFLTRHWYDWAGIEEKGAAFNKNIEYLLTTFFSCHHNKLKVIQTMTEKLQEEVNTLNNKNTSLVVLPNINNGNCNVLLRVLLKTLATATKQAMEESTTSEKLTVWTKVMNIMDMIVAVLKKRAFLAMAYACDNSSGGYIETVVDLQGRVKGAAPILRLFLTQGITVCSTLFRTESSQVVQLLKTQQSTTRYLQKIFDNTKLTEDSVLCAYLPSIRSLLESILLKVKNIMVLNNCTEAFFVGSMRNKDIQGQDILSQSTVNGDSDRMEVDENVTNNEDDDENIEVEDDPSNNDDDNSRDQEDENYDRGNESEEIVENESDGD